MIKSPFKSTCKVSSGASIWSEPSSAWMLCVCTWDIAKALGLIMVSPVDTYGITKTLCDDLYF